MLSDQGFPDFCHNKKHEKLLNFVETDIYPLDIISHYFLTISQCHKSV